MRGDMIEWMMAWRKAKGTTANKLSKLLKKQPGYVGQVEHGGIRADEDYLKAFCTHMEFDAETTARAETFFALEKLESRQRRPKDMVTQRAELITSLITNSDSVFAVNLSYIPFMFQSYDYLSSAIKYIVGTGDYSLSMLLFKAFESGILIHPNRPNRPLKKEMKTCQMITRLDAFGAVPSPNAVKKQIEETTEMLKQGKVELSLVDHMSLHRGQLPYAPYTFFFSSTEPVRSSFAIIEHQFGFDVTFSPSKVATLVKHYYDLDDGKPQTPNAQIATLAKWYADYARNTKSAEE